MIRKERNEYIALISVHGLIRGHDPELGRDVDTGGQVKYVLELARSLASRPDVGRVDLLTRLVEDSKVSSDYARRVEEIGSGVSIIRLRSGPRRYLRKEVLWPHLDAFVDDAISHFREVRRAPDILHGHYADAGYVGSRLAQLLRVPFVFTGHSLGRVKRQRLLDAGSSEEAIENKYHITRRIEAEEMALGNAALIVASTRQEVDEQYSLYENYRPGKMVVIPPGVDLGKFRPFRRGDTVSDVASRVELFLRNTRKPLVLALSRPDPRKNIQTLIRAYGEDRDLRHLSNLLIVAGTRDNLRRMDRGARDVLIRLLRLVDRYNLYGSVAYPKDIETSLVPELYRYAARSKGVFVNPALTEPFGLTLLEAAASGLPVVATNDGGPIDIIGNCKNGLLVDPLERRGMAEALKSVLRDGKGWKQWSRRGLQGVRRHYSWEAHSTRYMRQVRGLLSRGRKAASVLPLKGRLLQADRLLVSDIDNTLLGDAEGLGLLFEEIRNSDITVAFGIATGRRADSALAVLRESGVPVMPDLLITCVGSEIYYGEDLLEDRRWRREIGYRWKPDRLQEVLQDFPGMELQPETEQRSHKISYYIDPRKAPGLREIRRRMRQHDLQAKLIFSHGQYLDLLPIRASKGLAIRYLAMRWGLVPENLLVAGDSGNDEEMLRGNTLGVVVGNHSPELEHLRGQARVYFAKSTHARGILEGVRHYNFLGDLRIPEDR